MMLPVILQLCEVFTRSFFKKKKQSVCLYTNLVVTLQFSEFLDFKEVAFNCKQ